MLKGSEWVVYFLEVSNGKIYIGVTNDLSRRIRQHNGEISGGAKFTRANRPCKILASMSAINRSDACKTESRMKKLTRKEKLRFVESIK